jgi:hypothetical protein
MDKTKWKTVINAFSRAHELHFKTEEILLRIAPTNYGCELQVVDSYTGEFLRAFPCSDQDRALHVAEQVLYQVLIKREQTSLKDLIHQM